MVDARLLDWTGGYNYLRNLFDALRIERHSTVQPILFCGTDVQVSAFGLLASLVDAPIVRSAAFNVDHMMRRTIGTVIFGISPQALRVFKRNEIDVVFENARFFGWRFNLPTLAWLPDFQHRHLPELFSRIAYFKRELGFRLQLGSRRTVMVSSEAARRDSVSFYGVPTERIVVVRFASVPGPDLLNTDPDEIRRDYSLPTKFFFLPNQFWKHKNHAVVCRALSVLRVRGEEICIAVSGRQKDYRQPDTFDDVVSYVQRESIEKSFRLLGEIPYHHLIALMRASTALINPSLFEGWSTTVEEAKSLGVPAIVSDIPVHREQLGADGTYFDPNSETQLADILAGANKAWSPGPRADSETRGELAARQRVRAFAAGFETAVRRSLQNSILTES